MINQSSCKIEEKQVVYWKISAGARNVFSSLSSYDSLACKHKSENGGLKNSLFA